MAILSLQEMRARLGRGQRLIGIDPGSRTIGLALSDADVTLASPYGTLKRGKLRDTVAEILSIARREDAGGLVVGFPLLMDGSIGRAAQAVRDWATALSEETGLPVALWDERLSTVQASRFLICEADLSRRKRAGAVDRMAAALMLQSAIDAVR